MNVIWRWQRNFYFIFCAIILLAIYSYSETLNYVYLDPPKCEIDPQILILVTSNAPNFELRRAQRLAYSANYLQQNFHAQRIFLVAQGETKDIIENLAKETEANGDILLGQFKESYRHLHYKHLDGLQWATDNCDRAKLLIKMDDDISVDLPRIINNAYELPPYTIGGWVHQQLMVRRSRSKWAVTAEEYPKLFYPDFVSGWVYATGLDTIKILVKSAKNMKRFWIDDVWLTGIVREEQNLQQIDLQSWSSQFTPYHEHMQCCLNDSNFNCDFIAGPSKKEPNNIIEFAKLAKRCYNSGSCAKRPLAQSIWNTCQVKNPYFLPESSGVGKVLEIT